MKPTRRVRIRRAASGAFGAALALVGLAAAPGTLRAQGHGPVYGLSTPTLGKGGWGLDVAWMLRRSGGTSGVMSRPMLSYGVTEDLQVSVSWPVMVRNPERALPARAFTRMPAGADAEVMLGWRFHRKGVDVGTRRETTVWLAADIPTDETRAGFGTAPALFGAVVTGHASRSWYVWLGGAARRSAASSSSQERLGDVLMGSLVVGYRPPRFQTYDPTPDWRAFVEIVGERVGAASVDGSPVAGTEFRQVYAAVTVLGLYGWWGIAGGPAWPLYQRVGAGAENDGLRFVVNLSVWF